MSLPNMVEARHDFCGTAGFIRQSKQVPWSSSQLVSIGDCRFLEFASLLHTITADDRESDSMLFCSDVAAQN